MGRIPSAPLTLQIFLKAACTKRKKLMPNKYMLQEVIDPSLNIAARK
jgi:hypothetical protein